MNKQRQWNVITRDGKRIPCGNLVTGLLVASIIKRDTGWTATIQHEDIKREEMGILDNENKI